jgi:hypothetical protein
MNAWLRYLLCLTLLWNAVALPWAQSPCPHRAMAESTQLAQQDMPCHSRQGASEDRVSKSPVTDPDSCKCGCILHALPASTLSVAAQSAPELPRPLFAVGSPPSTSPVPGLRPPIA